jgi:erythromycin esterase-like protein
MNRNPILTAFLLAATAPGIVWLAGAWQAPSPQNAAPQTAAPAPVIEWIRSHAVPLTTPEAGHGFADMEPLRSIVGDARVVELGEATHGSREFFQMKHRVLEFLATEMGFTIFSIEANMPEAYRLNDYVLTGKGDPRALLKGMYFWTWDTEEVLSMIEWMRAFNQSGKGQVEFTGFDMQTPTVALDIAVRFAKQYDPDYASTLADAGRMAANQNNQAGFGVATATFPVAEAAGKRVHYSGYIKTEGVTRGFAGLWWRVDGASGVLAFDNMQNRGVTGTTDWKKYELDLPVAADAKNINFGALHTGDGTAWFDGLNVELDGKKWNGDGSIDLDFESPQPAGFYTGGAGYQVQPDAAVFQSDKQSLRMKFTATTPTPAVDPKVVMDAWEKIVSHLEAGRAGYLANGATAKDIDWAVQNARVVLQCVEMKAGMVSRDASMAENIQWILRQAPRTKMVVWAHNGHVMTNGTAANQPMGAYLRAALGKQMVAFGFAFNRGSFQAVEQGKGLHDFTVPPAPEGTLDATLAATGLPLFALDLRQTPATGPIADWFGQPHPARSIGAVYSDDKAAQFLLPLDAPKSFDALLFVEKTTAARPNTPRPGN